MTDLSIEFDDLLQGQVFLWHQMWHVVRDPAHHQGQNALCLMTEHADCLPPSLTVQHPGVFITLTQDTTHWLLAISAEEFSQTFSSLAAVNDFLCAEFAVGRTRDPEPFLHPAALTQVRKEFQTNQLRLKEII